MDFTSYRYFIDLSFSNFFKFLQKYVPSLWIFMTEKISLSLSLCGFEFLSFSFLLTFYLLQSISLSLSLNSFVHDAHQWLFYGVMSSSITLINAEIL